MSEERMKERCKREDIAFKVVQGFLEKYCDENTELYYSLQTILDLYNKEKEKNKALYDKGYKEEYIKGVQPKIFENWAKSNAKTIKIKSDYISKDKIKEKIEKYNKIRTETPNSIIYTRMVDYIDCLNELLGE